VSVLSEATEVIEKSFDELGLSEESLAAIRGVGYKTPSPIQREFIPIAVTGRDCMGQARTGTGKTAAFVLPSLERINPDHEYAQVLVLTPTRELSEQVAEEARRLSSHHPVRVATCVGGKKITQQVNALKSGAQIVVGTPGRVLDLLRRQLLRVDALKVVVLDEADRMLDIGFRPDIERILRQCPADRQTLLLSATLPPPVERLAQKYMRSPERVNLSSEQVMVETIEQYVVTIEHDRKFEALVRLLVQVKPRQAIVFCRTKRGTDKLYRRLAMKLPRLATIHGDLAQSARDRAMKQFREGKIRLLVATDVVGRGIDVSGVSHIFNYDIPEFSDDYVHRVGRTGRLSSGDIGMAFTFVTPEEGEELTRIEIRINTLLQRWDVPGLEVKTRRRELAPPVAAPVVTARAESHVEEEDPHAHFGAGVM
jgi:ATP-dependent RNA helicase DeaD